MSFNHELERSTNLFGCEASSMKQAQQHQTFKKALHQLKWSEEREKKLSITDSFALHHFKVQTKFTNGESPLEITSDPNDDLDGQD